MSRRPVVSSPAAWWQRVAYPVLRLPRLARIALVTIAALGVALLIFPLVDRVYLENFYDPATAGLPALGIAAVGLLVYALGWGLLLGLDRAAPPARPLTALYLLAVLVTLLAVIALLAVGVADLLRE